MALHTVGSLGAKLGVHHLDIPGTSSRLSGVSVALAALGGIVLWSGIKGATLADTFKAVLSGNPASAKTSEGLPVSGAASAPAAGAVDTSTETADGKTIYTYLRQSLGWTPIQAAGALAAMWGESTWNPEAKEAGGTGLGIMQWSNGVEPVKITGNASADMAQQLPLIMPFVTSQNDVQYVNMMNGTNSVTTSANIFGQHVEKFGVNDVHAQGVAAALAIANQVDPGNGLVT